MNATFKCLLLHMGCVIIRENMIKGVCSFVDWFSVCVVIVIPLFSVCFGTYSIYSLVLYTYILYTYMLISTVGRHLQIRITTHRTRYTTANMVKPYTEKFAENIELFSLNLRRFFPIIVT